MEFKKGRSKALRSEKIFVKLGVASTVALGQFALAQSAVAFAFDTGIPDLNISWDNTFKYSTAFRVKAPSEQLLTDVNSDDADRNFHRGLISNRLDVLSEFDITYKNIGARVSAAAWYDSVYNSQNANNSPATANNASVPYNEFNNSVRDLHGRKAEILDAFAFGAFDLGSTRVTVRAGRHALVWGESLFYGANGIAYGQGSTDVIKALSVPNTQFKEVVRPENQISGQLQVSPNLAFAGYYQFEWEALRLPGVGSYFASASDGVGGGGERIIAGSGLYLDRAADIKARNSGQGGLSMRLGLGEVDFGLYAIQYHDKAPQSYVRPFAAGVMGPGGQIGTYTMVYPEDIRSLGMSASTSLGNVNLAGEASIRRNTPLVSDSQVDPTGTGNNNSNPLYAVGNTAHAQVSWIASIGPSFLARESSFIGEIAWNRTTSITKNADALTKNSTRDAANIRMVFQPTYRQVWSGVDLSVPVGVGYGLMGNSSAVAAFLGRKTGDLSVGVSGSYLDVWRFSLTYTHYFGPAGTFLENGTASFKQTLKDKDFVALSISRAI